MPAGRFLATSIAAALLLTSALATPASAGAAVGAVVPTDRGPVRGAVEAHTRTFSGIPYAAPPVGERRWRAPEPAARWSGVRDATVPGPRCPQLGDPVVGIPRSENEDCLYLNVTTPRNPAPRPRPVMVWLHGGGMRSGAGSDSDPRRLAATGDVIVVTPNYRLGIFGFFGYPGLTGSGTFGLQDQQAALRWVRRNAAFFGGDPANVTLFGESAGGDGVCAQLASPLAAGLFDRAILQSGSCTTANPVAVILPVAGAAEDTWKPRSLTESLGARTATEGLRCDNLACLRARTATELLATPAVYWSPAFDTPLLPVHPAEALRTGHFNRVPVLAGHTRDEGRFFVATFFPGGIDDPTYQWLLTTAFGDRAGEVAARYAEAGSPSLAWAAIVTDRAYVCPSLVAGRAIAARAPYRHYLFADRAAPQIFALPAPPPFPMGAYHGAELPYLFDMDGVTLTAAQRRLADQMIRYWTAFAASGDPERPGLPRWPSRLAQSLAPDAVGPVDLAAQHHCGFWAEYPS